MFPVGASAWDSMSYFLYTGWIGLYFAALYIVPLALIDRKYHDDLPHHRIPKLVFLYLTFLACVEAFAVYPSPVASCVALACAGTLFAIFIALQRKAATNYRFIAPADLAAVAILYLLVNGSVAMFIIAAAFVLYMYATKVRHEQGYPFMVGLALPVLLCCALQIMAYL